MVFRTGPVRVSNAPRAPEVVVEILGVTQVQGRRATQEPRQGSGDGRKLFSVA